jgi:geranylgeranyl reductase family protein
MRDMHDVIVVGAGPAGLRSASLLERSGLDVLVIDRKPAIGRPVQCSGLISRNLDRFLKVPKACIEHRVSGAIIHGPGERKICLEKPGNAAYVIDRELFDRHLAGQVKSEVLLSTAVRSLAIKKDVTIRTDKGEFRSRALLGCDGPHSVVREHFGVKPHEMLSGLLIITNQPDKSSRVDLHLDRRISDGFLWKIPRGKTTEYGMLGSMVDFNQITRFFKLKSGDIVKRGAGLIPVGPCKSYFDHTLLVGDAAGQTKPWSGGGVVYGLTCAGHAARTLTSCLAKGDLAEKALASYEEAWKRDLERPISMGMMGRELYREMDNSQLARFMDSLKTMDLNSLDMDFPLLEL